MTQAKICFIGAGNMTRSIVSGLVKHGYPAQLIYATNPSIGKLDALKTDFNIQVSQDNLGAANACDVIVLGVKPQLMQGVCEALQGIDLSNKLVITIAAGIVGARYQDYFQQEVKLIRAMPNTPTQIGFGITGLYAGKTISDAQKELAQTIMATGGQVVWVEKEEELNLVIALAGSSPAYFFLFVESMIEAGTALGMDAAKSRQLAEQAALGAAQMLIQNQDISPAKLRENVTSKGGTTAQALETFELGGLRSLVKQAMANCIKRAEEMAKLF